MKNFIRSFFYTPKYGKVDDKVMMSRVVSMVITVVLCLGAMGFAAYAYFSHDINSATNTLKAARFEIAVEIQVLDADGTVLETIDPITGNHTAYKANLEADKAYTITIAPTQDSTAKTGFVVVQTAVDGNIYHTQQLGNDTNAPGGRTEAITFQVTLAQAGELQFLAHWGTSYHYADYQATGTDGALYITQNELITIGSAAPATTDTDGYQEPLEEAVTKLPEPPEEPENPDPTESAKTQEEEGSSEPTISDVPSPTDEPTATEAAE